MVLTKTSIVVFLNICDNIKIGIHRFASTWMYNVCTYIYINNCFIFINDEFRLCVCFDCLYVLGQSLW